MLRLGRQTNICKARKKLSSPEGVVGDGGNVAVGEENLLQVGQVERQEDVRPAMETCVIHVHIETLPGSVAISNPSAT